MAIKKGGYILSGALSLVIAGTATVNGMQNAAVTNITIASSDGSDNAKRTEELFQSTDISDGVTISFTAPVSQLTEDGSLVFTLEQPDTTVTVPSSEQYDIGDTISVKGIILDVSENGITLQDCVISEQEAAPQSIQTEPVTQDISAPSTSVSIKATSSPQSSDAISAVSSTQTASTTTSAATSITEAPVEISITVYVSSTGKYHSKSNCSGMKTYTEMSLDEAIQADHTPCKKCW